MPFGLRRDRIGRDLRLHVGFVDRAVEGLRRALHDQRVGVVLAEAIAVLLIEQTNTAVAGADADEPLAFSGAEAAQLQGSAIAEWGASKKGWKTGYLLVDTSVEYTKSVCYGFELGLKAKGGKIVGQDTFKNDDPSIATQITRLKAATSILPFSPRRSYPPNVPSG
jgi:ABC-type branched-subunit amino acid transport system substrate-binding protein